MKHNGNQPMCFQNVNSKDQIYSMNMVINYSVNETKSNKYGAFLVHMLSKHLFCTTHDETVLKMTENIKTGNSAVNTVMHT